MDVLMRTALWAAAMRAEESERRDRLFRDPLARSLAGEEGLKVLALSEKSQPDVVVKATRAYIAIRTRLFDDLALEVAADGVRQVVMLGAGMDTRAFRLAWPAGTKLFELDRQQLLDAKSKTLVRCKASPRCARLPVAADLTADWSQLLLNAGFDPAQRSLWLAEAFFQYLPQADVDNVISVLSQLAAGRSTLAADFISKAFFTSPWLRDAARVMEEQGMAWIFATDEPETLLADYGWEAEVVRPGEPAANFQRWPFPVAPRELRELPQNFLVIARKRDRPVAGRA